MRNRQQVREYMREYRKTQKWKDYHREYNRKWRAKHTIRRDNLRNKIYHEIKMGRAVKSPCAVCGEKKVEAHHPDYRSPLRVVWLCLPHHRERDVLEGKRKS